MSQAQHLLYRHANLLLALALVLLQAPLWLNPGYFSHDELQWAARAVGPTLADLPWLSFGAWEQFQFRPLTFNLWLVLSHTLFESPHLLHGVFVLLGTLNALLLAQVLRGAGARREIAFAAALVFGLSPFAVWVHGWVGCLADLLWVGAGLALLRVLQGLGEDGRSIGLAALAALVATVVGLYAKEAALSIPALLALGTVLLRGPRPWVAATLTSASVAVVYLGLRLEVLLHPAADPSYTVQAWAIPQRWLEYQVFPWALGIGEIHVLALASEARWIVLVLLLLLLAGSLWLASRRLLLAWLAGGLLALAPVLVLPGSSNQYGYGFMALVCGVVALAAPRLRRSGRIILGLLAALTVLHGFQIQAHLLRAGRLQAVFSPSLAQAAQARPEGDIRLWPDDLRHRYVFERLSHDIPSYRGVPLGPRVGMAASPAQATHRVALDGSVYVRADAMP